MRESSLAVSRVMEVKVIWSEVQVGVLEDYR
jgi:hypothetical protein